MKNVIKKIVSLPFKLTFNLRTSPLWTNSETQKAFVAERFILTRMPYGPYLEEKLDYTEDSYDFVRTYSMELYAKNILENKVPGSIAELGVFNGAFAKRLNGAFPKRKLYLFDTFEGFPTTDLNHDIEEGYETLVQDFSGTSPELVLSKMPHRENCIIKKGYFPSTAEGLEENFAFVNIDTDLYLPIYEGLKYFYPRLSQGGAIFIHDYNNKIYEGAKAAVDTFISEQEQSIKTFPLADYGGTIVLLK